MSDNTFWILFWLIVASFILIGSHEIAVGNEIHALMEKCK